MMMKTKNREEEEEEEEEESAGAGVLGEKKQRYEKGGFSPAGKALSGNVKFHSKTSAGRRISLWMSTTAVASPWLVPGNRVGETLRGF